jgi:hypothetical protein
MLNDNDLPPRLARESQLLRLVAECLVLAGAADWKTLSDFRGSSDQKSKQDPTHVPLAGKDRCRTLHTAPSAFQKKWDWFKGRDPCEGNYRICVCNDSTAAGDIVRELFNVNEKAQK